MHGIQDNIQLSIFDSNQLSVSCWSTISALWLSWCSCRRRVISSRSTPRTRPCSSTSPSWQSTPPTSANSQTGWPLFPCWGFPYSYFVTITDTKDVTSIPFCLSIYWQIILRDIWLKLWNTSIFSYSRMWTYSYINIWYYTCTYVCAIYIFVL